MYLKNIKINCDILLQNSTDGMEKLIGDSLRTHPENMFYDPRQVIKKLMTGKHALAQVSIH